MSQPQRYITTEKFHIVPLLGLTPDALKKSAKACDRDREKIGHNTLLNLLAKKLGVAGGFAGYQEEYQSKLVPFMEKHELKQWADLVTPRSKCYPSGVPVSLDVEQLADRFFVSCFPMPDKVFTGYDFDYGARYDDGGWRFNHWPLSYGSAFYNRLMHLKGALEEPDKLIDISGIHGCERKSDSIPYAHLVVGGYLSRLSDCFNLRGDLLVDPVHQSISTPSVYFPLSSSEEEKSRTKEADSLACKLFRREIENQDRGWVDVIQYNEHLVFLKGRDGQYDFVVKGMKKEKFNHQIYAPYLKAFDVPRQMNDLYDFQRWYYFEFHGWREQSTHQAEKHFYKNGGEAGFYPGQTIIWKDYFSHVGMYNYQPAKVTNIVNTPFEFKRVEVNGKRLRVSQLISIDELVKFSNQWPEYFEQRLTIEGQLPDSLEPMNSDRGDFPAAVTWFDACAFASYIERSFQLPVRLLKLEEYRAIRQYSPIKIDILGHQPSFEYRGFPAEKGLFEFLDEDGESYGLHPPYMEESAFQALRCKYIRKLEYIEHKSGLKFVDSNQFCEWLYENPYGSDAVAITSKSLLSVAGLPNPECDLFPASSTGKYKHCKIGFRLCYEEA